MTPTRSVGVTLAAQPRTPGAGHIEQLRDHGNLLVRRAILRDDWIADALLDLAANGQREWTPKKWDALLAELGRTDMCIDEWLDFYA